MMKRSDRIPVAGQMVGRVSYCLKGADGERPGAFLLGFDRLGVGVAGAAQSRLTALRVLVAEGLAHQVLVGDVMTADPILGEAIEARG
jgi:hypothetical protein